MKFRKGGSIASDNVMQHVSCEASKRIEATNLFGGSDFGAYKIHNATGGKNSSCMKMNENMKACKGGNATAASTNSAPAPGIAAVSDITSTIDKVPYPPLSGYTVNHGKLDYSSINGTVLDALKAEVQIGHNLANNVVYPIARNDLLTLQ